MRAAKGALLDACAEIQAKTGFANSMVFVNGRAFLAVNKSYWKVLKTFKKKNDFDEGERINAPKITALTMFIALTNPQRFFKANDGFVADETHIQLCYFAFCLYLIETFLNVRVRNIANQVELLATVKNVMNCKKAPDSVGLLYTLCMYMLEIAKSAPKGGAAYED